MAVVSTGSTVRVLPKVRDDNLSRPLVMPRFEQGDQFGQERGNVRRKHRLIALGNPLDSLRRGD